MLCSFSTTSSASSSSSSSSSSIAPSSNTQVVLEKLFLAVAEFVQNEVHSKQQVDIYAGKISEIEAGLINSRKDIYYRIINEYPFDVLRPEDRAIFKNMCMTSKQAVVLIDDVEKKKVALNRYLQYNESESEMKRIAQSAIPINIHGKEKSEIELLLKDHHDHAFVKRANLFTVIRRWLHKIAIGLANRKDQRMKLSCQISNACENGDHNSIPPAEVDTMIDSVIENEPEDLQTGVQPHRFTDLQKEQLSTQYSLYLLLLLINFTLLCCDRKFSARSIKSLQMVPPIGYFGTATQICTRIRSYYSQVQSCSLQKKNGSWTRGVCWRSWYYGRNRACLFRPSLFRRFQRTVNVSGMDSSFKCTRRQRRLVSQQSFHGGKWDKIHPW